MARKHHAPYPPEFRERAVKLVLEDGLTPNRVGDDLGVAGETVRQCISRCPLPARLTSSMSCTSEVTRSSFTRHAVVRPGSIGRLRP